MDGTDVLASFALAAALGALIGLERQVGRGEDEVPYAGLRTFALYGLWGAAAGFLGEEFGGAAFAAVAAAFVALIVAGYVVGGTRRADPGTTTEAAAFVTFVIGVMVWSGLDVPAVALAVGVAVLLRAKDWIHGAVARFEEEDLTAALRFGVVAAVVLPLLPDEDMGPFDAINPFEIWLMVVFVSGIGLVGYAALRLLGSRGLVPTGMLGGLVASTAVALGFSRMSRAHPQLSRALTAGIVGASGLLYPRVLIEAAVVEPDLARSLAVPLLVLFVGVEAVAVWWWIREGSSAEPEPDLNIKNPVSLPLAIQFGLFYGAVVFVATALLDVFSSGSLTVVGAVSGINDLDAITLATANLVQDGTVTATAGSGAVYAALAVNSVVKAGMAAVLGGRELALRVGVVLGAAAVGAVVPLVLL